MSFLHAQCHQNILITLTTRDDVLTVLTDRSSVLAHMNLLPLLTTARSASAFIIVNCIAVFKVLFTECICRIYFWCWTFVMLLICCWFDCMGTKDMTVGRVGLAAVWYYRVGQKNRTCLSVDNSAMVTHRKACDMSKVLECCRQKGLNLHSKSF